MNVDDGGSAFPVPEQRDANGCGINEGSYGQSLRDHFAGQAMIALLSNGLVDLNMPDIAQQAYDMADAMIRRKRATE